MAPGRAQVRRSLQCWACELQAKLLVAAAGIAGAAGVVHMMENSVFKIPSWIPICCESQASEVKLYTPTDYHFRNFTISSYPSSDAAHLAPGLLDAASAGCPVEFPNMEWSKCYWNGSYAVSEAPAWGPASLVPHALTAFAAGALLGALPFVLGLLFFVLCLPRSTRMDRHGGESW